jgi:rhodanese-related sulfurtransferase
MDMTSAVQFFAAKLAHEADVADVMSALAAGNPGFVLIDSRGDASWQHGRIPGALHLPTAELDQRATDLDPAVPIVTYCWGPGCNGASRSALALSSKGFTVREMIGGFEYWAREGGQIETDSGLRQQVPDPLTVPAHSATCDC